MPEIVITAEAGIVLEPEMKFRADAIVTVGDKVAQGQPILRDRRRPECVVTAPMAGHIAELEIGPGRRLTNLILYREDREDRHTYEVEASRKAVSDSSDSSSPRHLLQEAGLWMRLRARPFGSVPHPDSRPAALFIMAVDTQPLAPDPRGPLVGEMQEWFKLGLDALALIGSPHIYICQDRGADIIGDERVKTIKIANLHPMGLAGFQIRHHFPARLDRQVWDVSLEDVCAIGYLLTTGHLPATRLISIAGPGMRKTRLVCCQPGADLREISQAYMAPGQHSILSGSVLDGRESRWLGYRHRQASVIKRPQRTRHVHWLEAALKRASRPMPVIATAALEHALGGMFGGMALLRALSVGDDEEAIELGALSLLEEDLALADYVTDAEPRFATQLRTALNRIEVNT